MSKKDYYDILGVSRGVNEADLKKAFRRLAMKYHPDRNPDNKESESKFKEIKEAYEVLSNPQKRQAYDQFGHAGVQQGAGGFGGFQQGGGASPFGDIFEDIFGDIFGGGAAGGRGAHARGRAASGPAPERGADLRYNLEISLEDAVFGKHINIKVPTFVGCEVCDHKGIKKGSKPVSCTTCHGVGQVRMQQGFFTVQQTCPACYGAGQIIKDPCAACGGHGRVRDTKNLSVKIPAGVDTGDRVRLSGEGEAGRYGGPSGDLYVQISVKEHDLFTRDGDNLSCNVPVSLITAALGGEVEVPTLQGKVSLKIPAETQSGKIFRIRGRGVPKIRSSSSGDLLCNIQVETPINLNNAQKELLKQLESSIQQNNHKHSPTHSTWLNKVKKFIDDIGKK